MKIEKLLKKALPKWKYAARSKDGNWYFFSCKPKPRLEIGNWEVEEGGEYLDLAIFGTKKIDSLSEGISWEDSLISRNRISKKAKTYKYFVCFNFSWNQAGNMIIEIPRKIKTNKDLIMLAVQIQENLNSSELPFISSISKL